jgi:hypothetical protein
MNSGAGHMALSFDAGNSTLRASLWTSAGPADSCCSINCSPSLSGQCLICRSVIYPARHYGIDANIEGAGFRAKPRLPLTAALNHNIDKGHFYVLSGKSADYIRLYPIRRYEYVFTVRTGIFRQIIP